MRLFKNAVKVIIWATFIFLFFQLYFIIGDHGLSIFLLVMLSMAGLYSADKLCSTFDQWLCNRSATNAYIAELEEEVHAWRNSFSKIRKNCGKLNISEIERFYAVEIIRGNLSTEAVPSDMDIAKIMEYVGISSADSILFDVFSKYRDNNAPPPRPKRTWKDFFPIACLAVFFVLFTILSVFPNIPFSPSRPASKETSEIFETDSAQSHSVGYAQEYVGSINSDLIHRYTCRHAENIQEKNRVYYKTIADAIADGRSKCSVCFGTSASETSSSNNDADNFTSRYLELRKQREESPSPLFR